MTNLGDWPRVCLTTFIVAYFGYALVMHYDVGLEEELKNILMIAVGYWLGNAKRGATPDASGKPDDPVNFKPVEGN